MGTEKRKSILIAGYYGHGNAGDESILFCIAEQLKNHDITVISLDTEYTKRVQGLSSVDFFNLDEIEGAIKKSDMVIMGSGGLFQEFPDMQYYETKVGQLFKNPYGKLMAFAVIPIIAAIYHKPLFFLGHGVGPFYSEEAETFYRYIFSLPLLITVRDNYSYAWVKKLGRDDAVYLSADPAFLINPENEHKIGNILKDNNLKEKEFITLSLRDWLYPSAIKNTVNELALTLNDFLVGNELRVVFIPFQEFDKSEHPTQDIKVALQLVEKLDKKIQKRIVFIEDSLKPQEIVTLLDKCLFGIGMRYHFLIFSLLNNIPVLSLSYDEKCHQLMKEMDLRDLSIDIFEINHQVLLSKMNKIINHMNKYKTIIKEHVPQMKERALYSFTLLNHSLTSDIRDIGMDFKGHIKNEKIDDLSETKNLVLYEREKIKELRNELFDKERVIEDKERTIRELNSQLSETYARLNMVYNSKTWKIGQLYGKLFYHTKINKLVEFIIDKITKKNNHPFQPNRPITDNEQLTKLKAVIEVINNREKKGIFIVTSAFEFDEFYNQRVINLSKYLANRDFSVAYIAWRWSKDYIMPKSCEEVYPNIFQIPVDYFFDHHQLFTSFLHNKKYFVIEFPHPNFFTIMLQLKEAGFMLMYDIIDEWEEFNKVNQASWFDKDYEDAIVINADVLTAVSVPLIEKFSALRTDISLIPNGFSSLLLGEKENISGLNKKNNNNIDIGYFGHLIDSWFDWDAIFKVAKKNSDFIFHIIGYGESEKIRSEISGHGNIEFYGKVHPSELHRYAANWDVAVLPFKNSALSNAVDPIKIYEYLYFGLPTVVQGINHLNNMPYVHNCKDSDEFEFYIRKFASMKRNSSISYREIEEFLKECSWEKRFDLMISLFDGGIF